MKHHEAFEILEISPESNKAQVKAAYRKLAAIHHPDRGGDGDKFDEVNQAYQRALALAPECTNCGDEGSITTQRGFHSVRSICPICRGGK